jgi:hypothetical protein
VSVTQGRQQEPSKNVFRAEMTIIYSFATHLLFFSRSGVETNFSDVNIVTEVEHFLPREQIFANTCSLGSFHFFYSCDKNPKI